MSISPMQHSLLECQKSILTLLKAQQELISSWPEKATEFCMNFNPQFNVEAQLEKTLSLVGEGLNHSVPLKLLLLGGTGVGKSSLINALAQTEISSVSHSTRAHTSGFILYLHERWREKIEALDQQEKKSQLPFWPAQSWAFTATAYHRIEGLSNLWIIDAPDIDSIISLHQERVKQLLPFIDLPIWVSSPQKYRDLSCKKILLMIDRQRAMIAIMNQVDLVSEAEQTELLEDAQVFMGKLGYQSVKWFATSARQKVSLESISARLFDAVQDEGVNQLKNYLMDCFDHQEIERVRSLRLNQVLRELLSLLDEINFQIERYQQLIEWAQQVNQRLDQPLFNWLKATYHQALEQTFSSNLGTKESNKSESFNTKFYNHLCIFLDMIFHQDINQGLTKKVTYTHILLREEEIKLEKSFKEILSALPSIKDSVIQQVLSTSPNLSNLAQKYVTQMEESLIKYDEWKVHTAKQNFHLSIMSTIFMSLLFIYFLVEEFSIFSLVLQFFTTFTFSLLIYSYFSYRVLRRRQLSDIAKVETDILAMGPQILDSYLSHKHLKVLSLFSQEDSRDYVEKIITSSHLPILTPSHRLAAQYFKESYREAKIKVHHYALSVSNKN